MVDRRTVLAGTLVGGVSALVQSSEGMAAQASDRVVQELARAVEAMREDLRHQYEFWEIEPIRDQVRPFLRANGKFPDYVEVGIDTWYHVHDWHVRFQQPLTVGRTPEGRYTILLQGTNVILRTDMPPGFVGIPYDVR
jgi:hypothetical protein